MIIFEGEENKVLKEIETEKKEMVRHPNHYKINPPIDEVMGVIELLTANMKGIRAYHFGNWLKYVLRAGKKDVSKEGEDLEKAEYCLQLFAKEVLKGK